MTDAMGQTELAALRARAYGPDADIHSDAVAMARLRQLEEAERGAAAERVSTAHAQAVDAVVVDAAAPAGALRRAPRLEVADPDGFGGAEDVDGSGGSDDSATPQVQENWWMQRPRVRIASLLFAAAAMLVATVRVTVSVTAAVMNHDSSVVARLDPDPTGEWPAGTPSENVGEGAVLYEPFEGGVVVVAKVPGQRILAGPLDSAALSITEPELTCMYFTVEEGTFLAGGCAYPGFEPTADLLIGAAGQPSFDTRFPTGTPLRFTLEDGVVVVRAGTVATQAD